MSRWLEIVLTLGLLLVFAPIFLLIAIAIKLESRGPVFYRQQRVGQHRQPIVVLKFRKMPINIGNDGPLVTVRFDPRLTRIGRILERTKLDELPQLFNVLQGHLALVGPRPEIEKFTRYYPEKWEKVLTARPGLIGLNQVYFRNESERFPMNCPDPEDYYIHLILPDKLDIDIHYIERRSLKLDLWIIFRTIWAMPTGAITGRSLLSLTRQFTVLTIDTTIAVFCYLAANYIWFRLQLTPANLYIMLHMIVPVIAIRFGTFLVFQIPRHIPEYFSRHDIGVIARSLAIGSLLIVGFAFFMLNIRTHSRAVLVIDFFLCNLSLLGYRWLWTRIHRKTIPPEHVLNLMIVGITSQIVSVIEILRNEQQIHIDIVGIVDNEPVRRGRRIARIPILCLVGELDMMLRVKNVDVAVMLENALTEEDGHRVREICRRHNVKCITMPSLFDQFEISEYQPTATRV